MADSPYREGYTARMNGRLFGDNPYAVCDSEWGAWAEGYADACDEINALEMA